MQIRKATVGDLEAINKLAHKIWNIHYPSIISQAQINYMLNGKYSAENLLLQMKSGSIYLVAEDRNVLIGYLSYSKTTDTMYFLDKLYVDTERHHKGIGKQLLDFFENEIGRDKSISLQVNRKNIKAINFYFKNGFVIEEAKDFDIGQGYFMKDFIMVKIVRRKT